MSAIRNENEYYAYEQVYVPKNDPQEEAYKQEQERKEKIERLKKQRAEKRKKKALIKNILLMASVAAMLSIVVFRSSVISMNNLEYINVKKDIAQQQMNIRDMELIIAQKEDLANIRNIAKNELNMDYASEDQIKYIEKEENAEKEEKEEEQKGIFEQISGVLSDIANALKSWLQ